MIIDIQKLVEQQEDGSVPIVSLSFVLFSYYIDDEDGAAFNEIHFGEKHGVVFVERKSKDLGHMITLTISPSGQIELYDTSQHYLPQSFNQLPLYDYMIKHGLINTGETTK